MSHPFLLTAHRDGIHLYSNEADLLLDVVENVAAVVPPQVLDEVGVASNTLEALLSWDEPQSKINAAAFALDRARSFIPAFGLTLGKLSREEAIALAHDLLRVAHNGTSSQVAS